MRHLGRLLGYGFTTWVVALAISFMLYPLKRAGDPLFETLMTLVLASLAVLATGLRFRRLETGYLREGVLLGGVLLVVNLVLDLPLFLGGPLAMPLERYLRDIGYTYLVYPIVTIGTGAVAARVQRLATRRPPAPVEPEPVGHASEPVLS